MKKCVELFLLPALVAGNNFDLFTYQDSTIDKGDYTEYKPEDWDNLGCPDLEVCTGWPDKWEMSNGWDLGKNHCKWCPDDRCGVHHQSPIDLLRSRAVETDPDYNECIDGHWMAYFDSTCKFEDLRREEAFIVDRHALRVLQPIELDENEEYRLACKSPNLGRKWARIDFPKGFSEWWFLSHTDIHLPSEHTQDGKRYDGEIQLYHFYSVTGEEAGVHREMAAISIFIEAYDDARDYDVLNKLICAWREAEDKTRDACGLESIEHEYPGCLHYTRGHGDTSATTQQAGRDRALSAHDVIMKNHHRQSIDKSFEPLKIALDPDEDFRDMSDFDWDTFVAEQTKPHERTHGRKLLNYDHVPWYNYFPLIDVRTEYYFRYSGTSTIPPCYGEWVSGNGSKQTNHWRVMKDPIRISIRQLTELHRLLRERIAPVDDPVNACKPDTAASVDSEGKVNTARPIQSTQKPHFKVFCECPNWVSKFEEDVEWCKTEEQDERFFGNQPYNFPSNGL